MDVDGRKLIILGLGFRVTDEEFFEFFCKYGTVEEAKIMTDSTTGASRGFGFVTFANSDSVAKVLTDHAIAPLSIKGKTIDPKRAIPKTVGPHSGFSGQNATQSTPLRTRRIFIGKLPAELSDEQVVAYFQQFGEIVDCYVRPLQHGTQQPRNIAFITFANEDIVENVMAHTHQILGKVLVVDRAEPRKGDEDSAVVSLMPMATGFRTPYTPSTAKVYNQSTNHATLSTTNRVFVGRLPPGITQEHVQTYFQQFGEVIDCYLPLNHTTHQTRGIAFVTFAKDGIVDTVMSTAHQINGQLIAVDRAEPKKDQADGIAKMSFTNAAFIPSNISAASSQARTAVHVKSAHATLSTTNRVFVGRLPPGITQEQVQTYFQQFGEVIDCYLPLNHTTHQTRGIAFVTFAKDGIVDTVMSTAHQMNGQLIAVDRAEPKKEQEADAMQRTDFSSAASVNAAPQYLVDPTTGMGGYYYAAPITSAGSQGLVGSPFRSSYSRGLMGTASISGLARQRFHPY
jgi:RNA-binding protein Musashi